MKILRKILIPFIAIVLVVLFPHSGMIPVPFGYCIPVFIFVWIYLKRNGENLQSVGFSIQRFEKNAVAFGGITGIALFAMLTWAFFPVLEKSFGLKPANLQDFSRIRHNTPFYVFLLAMGWIVGGLYEEIVFHGFIFTRIEKMFAGKYAMPVGFIMSNSIFALYHLQLGPEGVINALIAGMVYHALMLHFKRNLWYAVFCHGIFDTIALTLLYAGY
jgi:uncharacterized protein